MKKHLSVLITGAGAPGIAGTIFCLRNNPDGRKITMVGTDIRQRTVGNFLTDKFHRLPPPEDPAYMAELKEIIISEGIDVIVPQTTREVEILSAHKGALTSMGVGIVASDPAAVATANDKYLILEECRRAGVPTPQYSLCDSSEAFVSACDRFGYPKRPVVVKPRRSSGMRGLRILTEEPISVEELLCEKPTGVKMRRDDFLSIFREGPIPELLVSEYLPGEEYTVDVFRNDAGCVVIPRIRRVVRSGISFDTRVDLHDDIVRFSTQLAESIDLRYCFGFQFKKDVRDVPKMLEGNPRVQGTMVTAWFAGFNMIYAAVKEALGEPVTLEGVEIKDGTEFLRYWGGVGISGGGVVEKI